MRKINPPNFTKAKADVRHLLPDEDPQEYQAFSDVLISELAPETAFQSRVAVNIINVEWDILRHRRLLAAVLRTEFCIQAGAIGQGRLPDRLTAIAQDPFQATNTGRALLRGDREAIAKMKQAGVTVSELTAAAFVARDQTVAYHETRIADLERRRRQLLADFEIMKDRRGVIEDLEVK